MDLSGLGARAGSGFVGRGVRPYVRPRPIIKTGGWQTKPAPIKQPPPAPVTVAPPVPEPVPQAAPLPTYQKRTISPVRTVTKVRTVYAVKKMPRAEPVLVEKTVSPKKTNWLPLVLGAGAALLMMKGGG